MNDVTIDNHGESIEASLFTVDQSLNVCMWQVVRFSTHCLCYKQQQDNMSMLLQLQLQQSVYVYTRIVQLPSRGTPP